jgi:hypothetical protein
MKGLLFFPVFLVVLLQFSWISNCAAIRISRASHFFPVLTQEKIHELRKNFPELSKNALIGSRDCLLRFPTATISTIITSFTSFLSSFLILFPVACLFALGSTRNLKAIGLMGLKTSSQWAKISAIYAVTIIIILLT